MHVSTLKLLQFSKYWWSDRHRTCVFKTMNTRTFTGLLQASKRWSRSHKGGHFLRFMSLSLRKAISFLCYARILFTLVNGNLIPCKAVRLKQRMALFSEQKSTFGLLFFYFLAFSIVSEQESFFFWHMDSDQVLSLPLSGTTKKLLAINLYSLI